MFCYVLVSFAFEFLLNWLSTEIYLFLNVQLPNLTIGWTFPHLLSSEILLSWVSEVTSRRLSCSWEIRSECWTFSLQLFSGERQEIGHIEGKWCKSKRWRKGEVNLGDGTSFVYRISPLFSLKVHRGTLQWLISVSLLHFFFL